MGQLDVVFENLNKIGQVSEDKKGDSILERKIWIIRAKKLLAQKEYQEEIKDKIICKILMEDRVMSINLLVFLNNKF